MPLQRQRKNVRKNSVSNMNTNGACRATVSVYDPSIHPSCSRA
jgi:hypothetical protein